MPTAWQILRDGGLPLAIEGAATRPHVADLARAVEQALAELPTGRDAEALAAFVGAWHQHWAASFAEALGDRAGPILAWADEAIVDVNRYLKLRRIAIANLSTII